MSISMDGLIRALDDLHLEFGKASKLLDQEYRGPSLTVD